MKGRDMLIKNTREGYGLIAITLHWIIALGFLGAYCAVYYRRWFTEAKTPENWTALQLHLSFGVTIAAFVVLRIIWKLMNTKPDPAAGTPLEQAAARGAHWLLYAFMIIMPITGYLGTGAPVEYFLQFEIPKFEDTGVFQTVVADGLGLSFKEFEKPMDFIHKNSGAYLVWVLIAAHAGAALYHHFVRRDIVLKRMLVPVKH